MFLLAVVSSHETKKVRQHSGLVHTKLKELITKSYESCYKDPSCYTLAQTIGTSKINSNAHPSHDRDQSSQTSARVEQDLDMNQTTQGFPCINGISAGIYPCNNIDMLSHLDLYDLGSDAYNGNYGNDIWGWTHPITGDEFALAGLSDGVSFVNITDPYNPKVIAFIDSFDSDVNIWRDMKIYKDWVYIVCDSTWVHGLQFVNLPLLIQQSQNYTEKRLLAQNSNRDVISNTNCSLTDVYVDRHANYSARCDIFHLRPGDENNYQKMHNYRLRSCHNIFINQDTGYLYAVGCDLAQGGLVIISLANESAPEVVSATI